MIEKRWILMPWGIGLEKRGRVEPGLGRQVLRGARGVRLSGFSMAIGNGVQVRRTREALRVVCSKETVVSGQWVWELRNRPERDYDGPRKLDSEICSVLGTELLEGRGWERRESITVQRSRRRLH